ncbi:hypothetical protein EV641_103382 [Rhodococcus sp. SMB37]|nr:hypothetical protein EV641_103382 [Rhodococcus sp. SMB37]
MTECHPESLGLTKGDIRSSTGTSDESNMFGPNAFLSPGRESYDGIHGSWRDLRNAPSPGGTSTMTIAEHLVDTALERLR